MTKTREDKATIVQDHVGAIQSYLDALRIIVRSIDDSRTACALDLLIEHAEDSRTDLANLFEELMEDRAC